MKFIALLITFIFIGISSFAYIPSADFIFSKIVKNAGTGIYQVKQEVTFPTATRNITVTETWWIQSDDLMFMKAEGPLFNQYFLYKKGKNILSAQMVVFKPLQYRPIFTKDFSLNAPLKI